MEHKGKKGKETKRNKRNRGGRGRENETGGEGTVERETMKEICLGQTGEKRGGGMGRRTLKIGKGKMLLRETNGEGDNGR